MERKASFGRRIGNNIPITLYIRIASPDAHISDYDALVTMYNETKGIRVAIPCAVVENKVRFAFTPELQEAAGGTGVYTPILTLSNGIKVVGTRDWYRSIEMVAHSAQEYSVRNAGVSVGPVALDGEMECPTNGLSAYEVWLAAGYTGTEEEFLDWLRQPATIPDAEDGDFVSLDEHGNMESSGKKASDFATAAQGAKADSAYQKPVAGIPSSDMSQDVQAALAKANSALQQHQDLSPITDLIPQQATSQNKLADRDFVNSSIGTATSTFRGTFNLVTGLSLAVGATEVQIATALASAVSTADNNDYVFVQVPTADATPSEIARIDRYKFNGTAWAYEFSLNNSSFTASQWAAINSGITSNLVEKLSGLPTVSELEAALAGKHPKIDPDHKLNFNLLDNVPVTPAVLTVSDITALAGEQLDALKVGDIVVKQTTNKKHGYIVAYKDATAGELYLVYCDHETIEGVYYAVTNDTWAYVITEYYPKPPQISTDIQADKNSNAKTASPKAVYDEVHPAVGSVQPVGGMLPNQEYDFGELSEDTTFALAAPADASITNHYFWTFDTGSTVPSITFPAAITKWSGNAVDTSLVPPAPVFSENMHYEVSVRKGVAYITES